MPRGCADQFFTDLFSRLRVVHYLPAPVCHHKDSPLKLPLAYPEEINNYSDANYHIRKLSTAQRQAGKQRDCELKRFDFDAVMRGGERGERDMFK